MCMFATTVVASPSTSGPALKVGVPSLATFLVAAGGTPSLVVVSSTAIGSCVSCKAVDDECC